MEDYQRMKLEWARRRLQVALERIEILKMVLGQLEQSVVESQEDLSDALGNGGTIGKRAERVSNRDMWVPYLHKTPDAGE